MVLLVDLLLINLGGGGGKDDGKIHHPSVNCSSQLPIFDLEVGGRAAAAIALCGGEVVRRMGVVGTRVPSHSGSYPLKNELMPLEIGCHNAWY
jgi:hypothetical protein